MTALTPPLFAPALRPSRRLLAHARGPATLLRLHRCLRWFPELNGTEIRVGVTRAADGIAVIDERVVRFDLRYRIPSRYTIAHELTHLLQGLGIVPHGEVACDLWTLARHPSFLDEPPCYLPLPESVRARWRLHRASVRAICHAALRRRAHHRHYIPWARTRLAQLGEGEPQRREAASAGSPVPLPEFAQSEQRPMT